MYYSDDPERDFLRHDAEKEEELASLPECDICGNPIMEEHFYLINGDKVCQECLENNYMADTEDYME